MTQTITALRDLLRTALDPHYWAWRLNEFAARANAYTGRTDERLDRRLAEQRVRWHDHRREDDR